MIAFEWLFPALFPSYLANSQYHPFIQSADIWGVLGLSGLISAIINPAGKITQQTNLFKRDQLLESIIPLQTKTRKMGRLDWVSKSANPG